MILRSSRAPIAVGAFLACALAGSARAGDASSPEQLLGLWRGTSLCTDRVAAPACNDETVVYEFTRGAKEGVVHWAADKVVNGERLRMGEMDASYDAAASCWKAEFESPRGKSVWHLHLDGTHLTGDAQLQPGDRTIRKLDLRRE